jgi:hypothetical protein
MKKLLSLFVLSLSMLFMACGAEPEVEFVTVTETIYDHQPSEQAVRMGDFWVDNGVLTGIDEDERFLGDLIELRGRSNSAETLIDVVVWAREDRAAMGRMTIGQGFAEGLQPGFDSTVSTDTYAYGLRCTGPEPGVWSSDNPADDTEVFVQDIGGDARRVTFVLSFDGEDEPMFGQFDVFPAP